MRMITTWLGGAFVVAGLCVGFGSPASALSMKECSAKYKAAKADGTLNGANWKSFRAANCGSSSASASAATPAATSAATPAAASTAAPMKPTSTAKTTAPAASMATGPATFPSAVDSKYAKESAGKARMHTCLDQYHANKANNGNGGLKWIQKGGGYYSECNTKLKA